MINIRHFVLSCLGGGTLLAAIACGGSSTSTTEPTSEPTSTATDGDRPEMSASDCEAQGGSVVGDIGDGAVHKPDYKCESGAAPIGRVPVGVEGSVCCK